MEEVERLGEEGMIEESLKELEKSEAIKLEKENKELELQKLNDSAGASGHQKLRVCDVCGAYLSVLDSDRRLADHFGGRVSNRIDTEGGVVGGRRDERKGRCSSRGGSKEGSISLNSWKSNLLMMSMTGTSHLALH
ncbi:hypothetical protein L7F22_001478 [Adiantum nelumboides]|nr:hypothetical protein [Adiantum nelumboides]